MSLVNNFTVKKVRSSNLELLRLLSMFFVLVVHADFQALGMPDRTEMTILPLFSVFRIIHLLSSVSTLSSYYQAGLA